MESFGWRRSPTRPYVSTGRLLRGSRQALRATIAFLRSAGRLEASCLWLGVTPTTGIADMRAVVVPKQKNNPQNYSISANSMQEVARIARPHGWTLIASIHSHPGDFVEHSSYDDEMMPSRHAFSLVFANYGAVTGLWPSGVGVHEYIEDYWHLLPRSDARRQVVFEDREVAFVDLRT